MIRKMFLVLSIIFVSSSTTLAENYGSSQSGDSAIISFFHAVSMDSGRVHFGYPSSGNEYKNAKLLPEITFSKDSTSIKARFLLDSIGVHTVRIVYWIDNATDTSGTVNGIWFHAANPIAKIDTALYWAGWFIGTETHTDYATDQDTIWIVSPAPDYDTLGIMIFYHTGAGGGSRPDSVKIEAKP